MAAGQQVVPNPDLPPGTFERERLLGIVVPRNRMIVREIVPLVDAPVARSGGRNLARTDATGRNVLRRNARDGDAAVAGVAGPEGLGVSGGFNSLLSTRMLQQESSAVNRALYEQDRQRQLELQRRATDIRVLVGP